MMGSCADKLGGGRERDAVQPTAKRHDDDSDGNDVGLRLPLLAAFICGGESASPENEQTSNDKEMSRGAKILATLREFGARLCVSNLVILHTNPCVGCSMYRPFLFFCSSLQNHGPFLMHLLAVLSHLRPRFAYILDH